MSVAVFFDLDNTLADFTRGALHLHGATLPFNLVRWCFQEQIGFEDEYDPRFWQPMTREFWRDLVPLLDGLDLFCAVERMLPKAMIGILTSARGDGGCKDGKTDWVRLHLSEYEPRLFMGATKSLLAAPTKVLIDDNNENVAAWEGAGGHAVLVPRPWNERGAECDGAGRFPVPALVDEVRGAIRLASREWSCEPVAVS